MLIDYNNIGKVIHMLRKHKRISRKQLCEGICSEKQLYRIETLQNIPTIYIVQQLSYRLGENLAEYLPFSFCDDPVYVTHEINKIETYYLNRSYKDVLRCIDEFDKYHCKFIEIKQLISWYEIIAKSNEGIITLSHKDLLDLLSLSTEKSVPDLCNGFMTDNQLRIVHSIISLHCKMNDFQKAKTLLIPLIQNLSNIYYSKNISIYLQLLYNFSKIYFLEKDYSNSIYTANTGISSCKQNNFLYILPDFYYISGQCYEAMGEINKAITSFRNFILLYDIQGHNKHSKECKIELINKFPYII